MNIIALIILLTLIIDFALSALSDYLNIKNLKKELPEEFSDVFDEEKYKKSQEYTKVRTKFSYFPEILSLAVTLVFWFSGGFNYLDIYIRDFGYSPLITGLIYIGVIMAASSLLSLPFSLYSTFVIEEKFGFNKTDFKTFLLDRIKGLLLSIVIGVPVLALILFILGDIGDFAWLYAWLAVTVITLVIQYIAPTYIMPLFNKFTPLEDGELRTKIFDYANKVNFPLKNIFVMDGSKRSTKSNAFFTGFGKNKRIALFDTLIEKHTNDELLAVLAHEIGHYKMKHIQISMVISILHFGVLFYLLSLFLNSNMLFEAFYMENKSIYAGLIFFGMLYSPVEMILGIFMNMLSRKNEFEADEFSAKTIDEPSNMISALKKLSADNLSNLTPHKLYSFLNYSHPPVLERINQIRTVANDRN
jgi:STE24 endopeptidase